MADRFWRGGTAAWDGTAGAKWAATAGGATGAAVPTSADDVFFDATSSGTCTISTGNTGAKSINCTGFTGTLAGNAAITVSGSITLSAGMTFTYTGGFVINATSTITSAGKNFPRIDISSGAVVTLGDALTQVNPYLLVLNQGTFNTNNYNVTTPGFSSNNSNVRSVNLGSSTFTCTGASEGFRLNSNTNLTFDAGTSTIVFTNTFQTIQGGAVSGTGLTFYNVSFTNTTSTTGYISSQNTFNNLTITGPSSAGVRNIDFSDRQTINGTLSTTGTAGNRRVWFRGLTYGLAQTLTVNSAPSLTDADFRDIYVVGTAAPISGTRIGDLGGCRGITFDTPKTVYFRLFGGGYSWNSSTSWSLTNSGSGSVDNYPLAQDTAVFSGSYSSFSININAVALPSIDASAATGTITFSRSFGSATLDSNAVYGSAFTLSSSVSISGTTALNFANRGTTTITTAGRSLFSIIVNSYGGTVELADALSVGSNTLTVTNGTFDTKNYNVTAGSLESNNSNVRTITLGSSTFTLSGTAGISFNTSTNLTFNAGTSNIVLPQDPNLSITCGLPLTFYNITANAAASSVSNRSVAFTNVGTIANLTLRAPGVDGTNLINFTGDATITGTFQVVGTSLRNRYAIRNVNPQITNNRCNLSVNTLLADNCDFEGINLTGAAINTAPSNAGDCGNNAGIVFPASKTLYWNLAGTQTFFSTGWATSSGDTPNVNNFPLAQDTAVFDDAGSAGTVSTSAVFRLGTLEMGSRTTAMTLTVSTTFNIFKNLRFGSGVTITSNSNTINISSYDATNYIKTNGVSIPIPVQINSIRANIELEDAFTSGVLFRVLYGQFNAKTYNVTIGAFQASGDTSLVVRMGSGTWTLTYSSQETNVWRISGITFYKDTADIVLSSTSTNSRQFAGESFSYNKLTIGGATGISTTTIIGNNQFTELASTKTVAHTIALGSTTQTFGKWTVTGTVGNVVTLTGTGTAHILAGACTDSIDYLAMGSIGFAATSPGEFYAGANSTGTAAAPVYRTAKPADSTRYWVGGTGNWSDTARWSTGSGGGSGASVPRSHDDVVFDSLSNATAYTATVNAVTGGIRMKALTIAGPLVGNLTLAGSTAIVGIHGNVTLPATGLTRTYTGAITLTGSTSGKTLTTNGVALASAITVNGVNCEWTLGDALAIGSNIFTVTNGLIDFDTYNFTASQVASDNQNSRTIDFGSGTYSFSGSSPINFGTTETNRANLTTVAGTAQINCSNTNPAFSGNNQTFYNVSFTSTTANGTVTINGANSFNNLSFTGITSAGLKIISITANQTITGTLTLSAGTNATMRHFVRSDTIGTTRTLTCAAVSLTDVDFRDITIAGVAAPATGTRIGDCKGNSGITFTAAANKYWNLAGNNNWSATGWALSSGASPSVDNFPLAQDTCIFESTSPGTGATITVNQSYNIGTIDMSARTTNTMTLATGSTTPFIYGNWINGTGTTLTGTGTLTFAGRGSQTITSAGKTFTQAFTVNSPSGSLTLQDAFASNNSCALIGGTFDANIYNVTFTLFDTNYTTQRSVAIGSGTWTISTSGTTFAANTTNLTVTGTGTISITSASAKTFGGGGIAYTDITLNQGGAGTLTISGNNTFKDITNTYKATGATNITLGTTTQRVSQWTAAGEAGRVLTVQGTSASSPATLVHTVAGDISVDYLTITGVRAYPL
jgi:fibronectin-binding autotransporter adhesin